MSKNWYPILEPKVLNAGMRIRSCLDMDGVCYGVDHKGDSTDEEEWYTAIVRSSHKQINNVYSVIVEREDLNGEDWEIVVNEDNLEFIEIYCKEWDD